MWIAGLDPGGKGRFAWCLATGGDSAPIRLFDSGLVSNAVEAVSAITNTLPAGATLQAVGIDSPLFWSSSERHVDRRVRDQIRRLGSPTPGGTVQHPNSLRGACLVQGVMAAILLREAIPDVSLTEAHPKALLWLLGLANSKTPANRIGGIDLYDHVQSDNNMSEHERDAALAAIGAWAMHIKHPQWENLILPGDIEFAPAGVVEYWMPSPQEV